MIKTRFDIVQLASNENYNKFLCWFDLEQVPNVGEVININGDPYLIANRGWAIDSESEDKGTYCYIDLWPNPQADLVTIINETEPLVCPFCQVEIPCECNSHHLK